MALLQVSSWAACSFICLDLLFFHLEGRVSGREETVVVGAFGVCCYRLPIKRDAVERLRTLTQPLSKRHSKRLSDAVQLLHPAPGKPRARHASGPG